MKGFCCVLFGGECVFVFYVRKVLWVMGLGKLINCYGLIEGMVFVIVYVVYDILDFVFLLLIGKLISNVSVYIFNE